MRVCVCSASALKRSSLFLLCVIIGGVLLRFPAAATTGISRGLAVCGQLLIPSLFPFLVLAGFLVKSGLLADIGRHLEPMMRRVFGLSGSAAGAMLISVLGGYPAGANAVMQLIEAGDIDEEEGRRLLCYCVNAGPAFVIGGVGVGMLGSVKAGVLLLIAHISVSLLMALFFRQAPASSRRFRSPTLTVSTAVVNSIHDAAASLIGMCGFVLCASCVVSLADAMGAATVKATWLRTLLTGFLEVSTGCMEAAGTGVHAPFFLGLTLGFGGLSVCGQVASRTAACGLVDRRFFMARLLHGLLGGCLSLLLFWWFPPQDLAAPAMAQWSVAATSPVLGLCGTVAMLVMCVLFLTTLPHTNK